MAVVATVIAAASSISPVNSGDKTWRRISNINKPQETARTKPISSSKPQEAARTKPISSPNLSKRGPVRCELAQSIVSAYAFENVEIKSCDGSAYVLEGTRAGNTFEILLSPKNGELLKVQKLQILNRSINTQVSSPNLR
jgi:hypothetical protein